MSQGPGPGGSQQLQQLAENIEALDRERQILESEIEGLRDEQDTIDEAIDAIDRLENGSTVQVPLGGGAYVRASIEDIDEIVVDLGGGYAAEREQDGAVETLESKKGAIDTRIEEVNEGIENVESETAELEQQARQAQQQFQQQLGGLGGGGPGGPNSPEGDDE